MLAALLPALMPVFGTLVERLIPDAHERDKAKAEMEAGLLAALTAADARQVEVNKVEAASASLFVAGWRPFIGWVGGVGLAYHFIGYNLLEWALVVSGASFRAPTLSSGEDLLALVTAMLGLGGLRTYEKFKGVAR